MKLKRTYYYYSKHQSELTALPNLKPLIRTYTPPLHPSAVYENTSHAAMSSKQKSEGRHKSWADTRPRANKVRKCIKCGNTCYRKFCDDCLQLKIIFPMTDEQHENFLKP